MEYYDMHAWSSDGIPGSYVHGEDVYIDEGYSDELWKPIFGNPSYFISNYARVWSSNSRRFIKAKPMDRHGHSGTKQFFKSQDEAARALGVCQANIWKVLNGQRTHTKGYYFEYSNRESDK